MSIVRNVWVNTEQKRPFSPMIKNMAPGRVIPISQPFTSEERQYIKDVAALIHDQYGSPTFSYKGTLDDAENAAVKQ